MTRMNSIESYAHAGRCAAEGRHRGDAGYADHWARWYRAALRLEEEGAPRLACAQAYEEAYRRRSHELRGIKP